MLSLFIVGAQAIPCTMHCPCKGSDYTHVPVLCRKAEVLIDFEDLPELPKDAFKQGTRKQTCLSSISAANTLLPEDIYYQVGNCKHEYQPLLRVIQCQNVRGWCKNPASCKLSENMAW